MSSQTTKRRKMIEGNPALIVIDIQKGSFLPGTKSGIPHMKDNVKRLKRAKGVIDAARAAHIPIIFFQEAHRKNMVDFGRELDGTESIHCLEENVNTEIADKRWAYKLMIILFAKDVIPVFLEPTLKSF